MIFVSLNTFISNKPATINKNRIGNNIGCKKPRVESIERFDPKIGISKIIRIGNRAISEITLNGLFPLNLVYKANIAPKRNSPTSHTNNVLKSPE